MINLPIIVLLIFVFTDRNRASTTINVHSSIKKLGLKCALKNDKFFDEVEKSGKLLGAGAFGKVFDYSDKSVMKIITLTRGEKEDNIRFAKKINDLLIEIDFMKYYSDRRDKFKGLNVDLTYNNKSFYIMQMYRCSYTTDKLNSSAPTVRISIELEKLDLDLDKFLKRNPNANIVHLLDITKKIIRGLYQVHQYGYVHLDLKPDNVMMRDPFEPVLIDFGLVYPLETTDKPHSLEYVKKYRKRLGILQGTPVYIDPNMFNNSIENISYYTDVYSLGVMMFTYFRPNKNYFEDVKNDKPKPNNKMEDIVPPFACEPGFKHCPFHSEDIHRGKYFRSLIYWLTREDLSNRLYLDFAMQKLYEIEQEYYKDCFIIKLKQPTANCFMDRKEYENYKRNELIKYHNQKKNKGKGLI